MTKLSRHKYGCISKSLDKFLSYKNDQQRKKEYGNVNAAKYYERIVKGINASFWDHTKAIEKLPDEYLKKIEFEKYYESVTSKKLFRKWTEQLPDKFLEEVNNNLSLFYQNLKNHSMIKKLAKPDFDKVRDWLYLFELMQKKGIKNL